jgi:Ca2+:H+ antiporter
MQGNIVLSLEIGSAYSLHVALLQIPVLVAFSAITGSDKFTLVFPMFDFFSVLLGVLIRD